MTGKIVAFIMLLLVTTVTSLAETNSSPTLAPFTVTMVTNTTSRVVKKSLISEEKSSISIARTKIPRNVKIIIRGTPGKTYFLIGDCKIPTNRLLREFVMPEDGFQEMGVGFPTSDLAVFYHKEQAQELPEPDA